MGGTKRTQVMKLTTQFPARRCRRQINPLTNREAQAQAAGRIDGSKDECDGCNYTGRAKSHEEVEIVFGTDLVGFFWGKSFCSRR